MTAPSVPRLYQSVIDEVIENMKEAVLDEGIDEQVLTELKQLWESKLHSSKVLEATPAGPSHYMIPPAPSSAMHRKTAAAATAGSSQAAATTTLIAPPQAVQIPGTQVFRPAAVRGHQTQPLDMSGAATTATLALPPMYQQHLLSGNIQLQQTSQGMAAIIPATAIQSGQIQHVQPGQQQPQNLSTKVHGQLDGNDDTAQTTSHTESTHDASCRPKTTAPRRRRGRRVSRDIEIVVQLDGADTSSDEDDDIDDEDDDDVDNDAADEGDEEPLNSGDDDEDDDASASMFEMENVIVCQYDKITRSKNKWRFTLKDGIMNINQKDYVFHKAHGEAEW